jgi:D-3-phosphoglycerate dehydrogenase
MKAGLPKFKVVSKFGVGVDNFDLVAANELGFVVCNVPGANSDAVADFTIAMMLAVARQIIASGAEVRRGGYRAQVGPQLGGRTLGIIGLGNIGTRVALRAKYGFEMRVIANDIVERPDFAITHRIEYLPKDEIYRQADFVSVHTGLTPLTRGMICARELKLMKRSAYLINNARGGIVDEDALYEALSNGQIAGAAIDVFAKEPPVGSKLLTLENVVVSAHTAGSSPEAVSKIGITAAHNLLRVLHGQKPIYTVTPDSCAALADA